MNAAMLLLVAGSFAPVEPTVAVTPSVFQTSVIATFETTAPAASLPKFRVVAAAAPRALTPAPAPRRASDKTLRFLAEGGGWIHPGQYAVFGGGVMFKPIKDKKEFDVQADVLLGWYRHTTFVQQSVEGISTQQETSIFTMIGINLLYALQMKMSKFTMQVGGGAEIEKGSGYTHTYLDLKILFSYVLASGAILRPEIRFGFQHDLAVLVLFAYVFP